MTNFPVQIPWGGGGLGGCQNIKKAWEDSSGGKSSIPERKKATLVFGSYKCEQAMHS